MSNVSKNIYNLRILNNMTQEDLAEKMFVTRQTVSNWENGRTNPDLDSLHALSEVFKTDITELIYGVPTGSYKNYLILKKRIAQFKTPLVCVLLIIITFVLHNIALYLLQQFFHVRRYDNIRLIIEISCWSFVLALLGIVLVSLYLSYNNSTVRRKLPYGLLSAVCILPMVFAIATLVSYFFLNNTIETKTPFWSIQIAITFIGAFLSGCFFSISKDFF